MVGNNFRRPTKCARATYIFNPHFSPLRGNRGQGVARSPSCGEKCGLIIWPMRERSAQTTTALIEAALRSEAGKGVRLTYERSLVFRNRQDARRLDSNFTRVTACVCQAISPGGHAAAHIAAQGRPWGAGAGRRLTQRALRQSPTGGTWVTKDLSSNNRYGTGHDRVISVAAKLTREKQNRNWNRRKQRKRRR